MEKNRIRGFLTFLLLVVIMAFTQGVHAQQKTIQGKVTDTQNVPLPGVSVIVKGTTVGAITSMDGSYTLEVPGDAGILVFSYIGMLSQEVEIGNQTNIDVTLEEDVVGLEEVVVVGYGTQKKVSVTGSIGSVGSEMLAKSADADAVSRLQGRVAGVSIQTDNNPGGSARIRIHGVSTINGGAPLYIIDGIAAGGLEQLNPNDIESISILKDASSAAIYGARAANGVVLVTTKKGNRGRFSVQLDVKTTVSMQNSKLDLMNTQQYADMIWLQQANENYLNSSQPQYPNSEMYGNGSSPVIPDYILPSGKMVGEVDENQYSWRPYNGIMKANKLGTDWYDAIYQTGVEQEYNLSISGGSNKSVYMFSGGYLDQKGTIKTSYFKRYTMRGNFDVDVTDWLSIGNNIGVTYVDQRFLGGQGEAFFTSWVYRNQPIVPVYDIAGNFAGNRGAGLGNAQNPVAILERDKDDNDQKIRVLTTPYISIKPIEGLEYKSMLGYSYSGQYIHNRTLNNEEYSEGSKIDRLEGRWQNWRELNFTNTLQYTTNINEEHNLSLLVGSEQYKYKYINLQAWRDTYFSTDYDFMILDSGEGTQTNAGSFDENKLYSFFGRLNYDYKSKYLLEAIVRWDGSSRFSKDNRWGTFPAFSAGWRVSEEGFMQDVDWLNNLKIRGGWGQNGNNNVGNYNSYTTYSANIDQSFYGISGGGTTAGYRLSAIGNADARWETTTTIDIGFDATLFDGTLDASFDWYHKLTTDMLYPEQKPKTAGNADLPNVNIGEMKNTGVDIAVTYHGSIGSDFKFDVTANASHYKNEVVKLNDNANEFLQGQFQRNQEYTRSLAGYPISSIYGYIVEGYFSPDMFTKVNVTDDDGNVTGVKYQLNSGAHAPYNTKDVTQDTYSAPGKFMFKDVTGDGMIDANDRTVIGNPHPDWSYGLNLDLQWKNLDATLFFQGVQGIDIVNYVDRWILFNNFQGNRDPIRLSESWTEDRYNSGANISMPIALNPGNDDEMQQNSTFFVEDASYLRLKTLQIGYTLPEKLLSKWQVKNLRFYVQATNLFTLTKYSGLDPEMKQDAEDRQIGIDLGGYPTPKTYAFGLTLNF